jgi:hypothetical protein
MTTTSMNNNTAEGGREGRDIGNNNNNNTVIFLSVNDQIEWIERETKSSIRTTSTAVGNFLKQIPYQHHIGRKNIGYLYAIQHGATIIYDLDDTNLLPLSLSKSTSTSNGLVVEEREREVVILPPMYNTTHLNGATMIFTGPIVFNYHGIMGVSSTTLSTTLSNSSNSSNSS